MPLYELTEFASYVQSDVDTATAALLLDLVTGQITEVDGKDYGDPATVVTPTVKAIALEAAARAYRNPNGIQSKTETIGNFNETERWNADQLGVFLTGAEKQRLSPALTVASQPWTGSIRLGPPYWCR